MGIEIERKFLVTGVAWRQASAVRLAGTQAFSRPSNLATHSYLAWAMGQQ